VPGRGAVARVTWRELPVDGSGSVASTRWPGCSVAETALVAVMLANNETGVVQPLRRVVDAVRERAAPPGSSPTPCRRPPSLDLAEATSAADLVALSAHKVGGPVGTGALAVRPPTAIAPRQYGGGQERERRSGTQDVVGAVGLATALRLAAAERSEAVRRVAALRDRLAAGLTETVPGLHRTVPPGVDVLPGHLHLCLGASSARSSWWP
jgi:cysteine desulfurase